MSQHRRRARHVRSHGDSPEAQLIVRQQVAGKRKQQGQHQQYDADAPIEFTRPLVRSRQHHPKHVQPRRDNHQVGRPSMHVPQEFAKRNVVLEIKNVAKGYDLRRVVIEH